MRLPLIAASATFAVDQLSKVFVLAVLRLDQIGGVDVLPPLLNFRMAWNRGVNFGLLDGNSELQRWILVGFAVSVAAAIMVWARRGGRSRTEQALAGALAGGAAGNAADRILYGAVVDFLNMSCCGIDNPFVFNLADVAVVAGAAGLIAAGSAAARRG